VLVWHAETMIERHVKVKGQNSPYNGDLVYWATRLKDHPMVRTREGRLIRDQKGRCAYCGMLMKPGDLIEIDHSVPKRPPFYGKDVYSNLQAIHGYCHDQKTAQFDQPGESIVSVSTQDNGQRIEEPDDSKESRPVLKQRRTGQPVRRL
jgi:RNA-directed DNA polymerase